MTTPAMLVPAFSANFTSPCIDCFVTNMPDQSLQASLLAMDVFQVNRSITLSLHLAFGCVAKNISCWSAVTAAGIRGAFLGEH